MNYNRDCPGRAAWSELTDHQRAILLRVLVGIVLVLLALAAIGNMPEIIYYWRKF